MSVVVPPSMRTRRRSVAGYHGSQQSGFSKLSRRRVWVGDRFVANPDRQIVPRQYSLVRFQFELLPADFHGQYPFVPGGVYVFFGDIPNMPGHCVVADHKTGKLFSGYHTEWFVELSADDV